MNTCAIKYAALIFHFIFVIEINSKNKSNLIGKIIKWFVLLEEYSSILKTRR